MLWVGDGFVFGGIAHMAHMENIGVKKYRCQNLSWMFILSNVPLNVVKTTSAPYICLVKSYKYLFVAAMTMVWDRCFNPSIRVKS